MFSTDTQLPKNFANISNMNAIRNGISAPQIISLEDVSVIYKDLYALSSIKLEVAAGEILFVTGHSGAGKTTLLKVLSGLVAPSKGKVKRANLFYSHVFQELKLFEDLSLGKNLSMAFDSQIYSTKKEFENFRRELTDFLGMSDRLDTVVRDANGGLKQKTAIIRALLSKPDVFIADEPTSALDYDNAKRLFDLLNVFNVKKKMTIIWASHNSELVKKFSGRIIHLSNSKLVYSGHVCFI